MTAVPARADRVFLLFIALLAVFGFVELLSASSPLGIAKFQDSYFYVKRQAASGLLPGAFLFLFFAKMDYGRWRRLGIPLYIFSTLLLILVFIPGVGQTINQSRSWLSIGPFSFQPAELAKLSTIIMAAALLSGRRGYAELSKKIMAAAVIALPTLLVLLQPDVGTVAIMGLAVFAVLYAAEVPARILYGSCALGAACFIALILAAPYRATRLTTFLHPELDPQGVGYQVNQAFLAVGSGGLMGLGFGHSRQKFQYLPEVNADSIFAILAEEMGFFVSTGVIILILLIALRGFKIAKGAKDEFGYLLAVGIVVWFAMQSFLNIGAMVGALPLTGVPLPLVSHGGSAMMSMLAAFGIVANVSKSARLS